MSRRSYISVLILMGMLLAFVISINAQEGDVPDEIEFTSEALYPEGIAHDDSGERFLVTSLTQGSITAVNYDGSTDVVIDDDDLVSTIGLRIDAERGRLLVANSDPGASVKTSEDTQGALAELGIYDLDTGERLFLVDLDDLAPEGDHFANDIAVDENGNAYVTDSYSPIIYVVDVDGNADIFLQDERFTGEGFNLNGIVFHPDGYLLVAKFNEGILFKIPLDDPSAFTQVEIDETFPGADGLLLLEDGTLFISDNTLAGDEVNQLVSVASNDDWASASVAASMDTGTDASTTATLYDGDVYVLFGKLDVLFNPEAETQASEFKIVRASVGMGE